jgi:hypothetical protein
MESSDGAKSCFCLRFSKDHVTGFGPGWSEGPDPESRDSGLALRAPRNDGSTHPTLATPTASSDSSITFVTSCSEVTGWVRQRAIFSMKDRLASKNSGS